MNELYERKREPSYAFEKPWAQQPVRASARR
jgi:hypothetical protein